MCTELLPPGGYPIAVKYIISYRIISYHISYHMISPKIISGTPYLTEFCTEVSSCNFNTASCTIQGDEGKKSQGSQGFSRFVHYQVFNNGN